MAVPIRTLKIAALTQWRARCTPSKRKHLEGARRHESWGSGLVGPVDPSSQPLTG